MRDQPADCYCNELADLGNFFGRRIIDVVVTCLVLADAVTDDTTESKCNPRHGGTDGNSRHQRQARGSGWVKIDCGDLVWLGVERDGLFTEHAGVVVLDLKVDRQDERVPVAVVRREGAVEGVHTSDTAADVGLFAGAVSTVASDGRDVAGMDPCVVTRAIITRVGAKEVVY